MGDDYVDYTLLQKKGILKLKEENFKNSLKVEGGFVDLTSFKNKAPGEPLSPSGATPDMGNFGFLSDMASVGSSNPSSPLANDTSEKMDVSGNDLSALKIKLDNMEYQFERFLERIDKLEEKLGKQ